MHWVVLQGTRTCRVSSASATGTIWSPASRRWPHLVLRPRAKRSLKHEEDKAPAARPPRSPAARSPGFHHMWPFPEERIPRSGPRNRDGAVRFAGSFSIIRTQRSLPSSRPSPGSSSEAPRHPPRCTPISARRGPSPKGPRGARLRHRPALCGCAPGPRPRRAAPRLVSPRGLVLLLPWRARLPRAPACVHSCSSGCWPVSGTRRADGRMNR